MMAISIKPLSAVLAGLILTTAGTAYAQTTNEEGNRSFDVTYFDQFAPQSALEMIGRIPGFQTESGNSSRGLGQGGANVLLNGTRLTGKGNDAFNQIARIPPENVIRIEILDGASLNIPGLSGQVANVITKQQDNKKTTGTWEWNPEWRPGLEANLYDGSVTLTGATGDLSWSAELESDTFRNGHRGPELRYTRPDMILFERLDEDGQYYGENIGGSVNLTWEPKEEHIGNLNLDYRTFNFNDTTRSLYTAFTDRGFDGSDLFTFAEDEWNAQIDGDYELPFWDGKLKMIGYYRVEDSPTVARLDRRDERGVLLRQTRFAQDADEGEAIGRVEYSWTPSEGRSWQVGVEGVFNFLDIESQFIDLLNPANSQVFDRTRVEELRSEATVTHTRTLSPKWDVQASLGAEYSEISQGQLAREFVRPKGFVSLTYKPADDFSIRANVEREVGQLNFFNFIQSVDLQDNLGRAANSNLVPDQSWEGELEFDKQFKGGHTFKARFYGEIISDLVDRILVDTDGDGFKESDAVGNIDSATRYGVDFDATIKGEALGYKGTELNLELNLRDSNVEDPITGVNRQLNGNAEAYWSISFRHDIPDTDWAWGFYSDQFTNTPVFRSRNIDDFHFAGPWGQVFIEHKDVFGMRVNVSYRNLFDASDDFERYIFSDRRDLGEIIEFHDQERDFGQFLRLNVSGTF